MYKKAIVTFLDVLGFRELVMNSDGKLIRKVLDAVKKSTMPNKKYGKSYEPQVVSFSDSIVRVRRLDTKENLSYPTGLLFQELLSLAYAQGELIDDDILIRGSVSFGDIYISGSRVFGPGLVDAYELESKYAIYPRIVVDPKLIQEYKSNKLLRAKWHRLKDDMESVKDLLKQGDDGMWFIDYGRVTMGELDEPEMRPIFLQRHREVILAGAKRHAKLNSILTKYIWMANYHNNIISEIDEKDWYEQHGMDKNDLLINSEDMPALQYMNL
jgi:hypothetical protein